MFKWIKSLFKNNVMLEGLYLHKNREKPARYVFSFGEDSYEYLLINSYGRLKNKRKKVGNIKHLMGEYSLSKDKIYDNMEVSDILRYR